jgi:hypothetical protein
LSDADEESSSDMLNKELDIDYDNEIYLKIEGESLSEESSNEMLGSETESVSVGGKM